MKKTPRRDKHPRNRKKTPTREAEKKNKEKKTKQNKNGRKKACPSNVRAIWRLDCVEGCPIAFEGAAHVQDAQLTRPRSYDRQWAS